MTGDRAVGWTALFIAGWLSGQWISGREALGQGTPGTEPTCRPLKLERLPETRKAARAWAQRYVVRRVDGVILK